MQIKCRNWTLRRCLQILILVITLILLLYIFVLSDPNYRNKPCLPLIHIGTTGDDSICSDIMNGQEAAIEYASQFAWCRRHDQVSDKRYLELTKNCQTFVADRGYAEYVVTEDEKNFPLAFSILMHENTEQTERLLHLIYRPHNVYCIHVDAKSSSSMHRAVRAIADCFDNVYIAPRAIDIHWGEFTLLKAELVCLRELFDRHKTWKYYINLMSREFPLKTNRELVKILHAYNGANDVDGTLHRRPIVWTMFVWKNENWRTGQLKSDPPHKFIIGKGSTHVAVSHAFVDYVLNSQPARDLLDWMKDIRAPDEHFFPTLNHNPHLGVPGAYRGDPDLKWFYARLKIWQSKTDVCKGQWVRYVCNLGVGDLAQLTSARHLFVNKIRLEQDPTAFSCLERWYINQTREETVASSDRFNVSFYANLPFALNHVPSS